MSGDFGGLGRLGSAWLGVEGVAKDLAEAKESQAKGVEDVRAQAVEAVNKAGEALAALSARRWTRAGRVERMTATPGL